MILTTINPKPRRMAMALGLAFATFATLVGFAACTSSEEAPAEKPIQGLWRPVEAIQHTYDHDTREWKTTVHQNPTYFLTGDWILEILNNDVVEYNYQGRTLGIDTVPWGVTVLPDGQWVARNLDTMTFTIKRDTLTLISRRHGADSLADRMDYRFIRYTGPFFPPEWDVRPDATEYIKHRLWKPAAMVRHSYDFDNNLWKVDSFGAGSSWISENRIIKVYEDAIITVQYYSGTNPRVDTVVWSATRVGYSRWIDRGIDTLIMGFRGDSMTLTQLPVSDDPTRSRYDWIYLKYMGPFLPDDWIVGDPAPPPIDTIVVR